MPAILSGWTQPPIDAPLFPQSLVPGDPSFVLTAKGLGFVFGFVVEWNGAGLPTTFVSSDQLQANVPSSSIVLGRPAQGQSPGI